MHNFLNNLLNPSIKLLQWRKKSPCSHVLSGLALMYVLREQGALVAVNSTIWDQFESTLTDHCPEECEEQFFDLLVSSDSQIDNRMANLFGAYR